MQDSASKTAFPVSSFAFPVQHLGNRNGRSLKRQSIIFNAFSCIAVWAIKRGKGRSDNGKLRRPADEWLQNYRINDFGRNACTITIGRGTRNIPVLLYLQ